MSPKEIRNINSNYDANRSGHYTSANRDNNTDPYAIGLVDTPREHR